jgi:hypothetical protein
MRHVLDNLISFSIWYTLWNLADLVRHLFTP